MQVTTDFYGLFLSTALFWLGSCDAVLLYIVANYYEIDTAHNVFFGEISCIDKITVDLETYSLNATYSQKATIYVNNKIFPTKAADNLTFIIKFEKKCLHLSCIAFLCDAWHNV